MEHLKERIPCIFNWDDIDVGNRSLDHSQNFFAQKHKDHEKYAKDIDFDKHLDNNKENILKPNIQEDKLAEDFSKLTAQPRKSVLPKVLPLLPVVKIEGNNDAYKKPDCRLQDQEDQVPTILVNGEAGGIADNVGKAAPTTVKEMTGKNPNLKLEWSHMGAPAKAIASAGPPRVYGYKDIYQHNIEDKRRKKNEEEHKKREFHSRPVPDFKVCHKLLEKRAIAHRVTCPETPNNLKTWHALQEKRKMKQEEQQRQKEAQKQLPRVTFPNYLSKQPFQPKLKTRTVDQKPFQLHSDGRVKERRNYNEMILRAQEDKKKQEAEARHIREQEEIKELRKMTEFKARPNPFK